MGAAWTEGSLHLAPILNDLLAEYVTAGFSYASRDYVDEGTLEHVSWKRKANAEPNFSSSTNSKLRLIPSNNSALLRHIYLTAAIYININV